MTRSVSDKAYLRAASDWRTVFVPMTLELQRAVVEGDVVVIEAEGDGTTADGDRYNNVYAYVMTVGDGRITSMREHCDTKLVAEIFRSRRPGDTDQR